jgi:hypothetical protein
LSRIKEELEITPGDSVLVIGSNGDFKKLIIPELNKNTPHTEGTEKVFKILKMFNPSANIETFENVDRRKLN